MGNTFQQAVIPVADPESYGFLHDAIATAFSAPQIADFLKSVDRSSLRIRDFETVLGKDLLGTSAAASYGRLSSADQGQIREFYLASLEHVAPELRNRFFKLYAYY